MANLLDWDLEVQVYPIVRWLVLHRRAKVVDVVHPGLKTAFALPPKFNTPYASIILSIFFHLVDMGFKSVSAQRSFP